MSNTQAELREQVLTEFKQVLRLAPTDYTENCTNVVMALVTAHTNKQIEAALNSLLQHKGSMTTIKDGEMYAIVPFSVIEAERKRLRGES